MGFSCVRFSAFAIFVTSLVAQTFGKFIVARHPPTEDGKTRKLTCISDDNLSALIWNYNHTSDEYPNFQPEEVITKEYTDCALYSASMCNATWENTKGWKVVDSVNHPMSPVSDYRWEGFKEFSFEERVEEEEYQHVRELNGSSNTVIFSARGQRDIFIILCKNEDPTESPCISIVIGSSNGKKSKIWTCDQGAFEPHASDADGSCGNVASTTHKTKIIDIYEWRTFRIEWKMEEKMVSVSKNNEQVPFLNGNIDKWHPISHILIRSERSSRVRFHFYEYFLTEEKDTKLSTSGFIQWNETFCVEMLVGLCRYCELRIELVDRNGFTITSKSYASDTKMAGDARLSWQRIILEGDFQVTFPRILQIIIKPIEKTGEGKRQWAVDNFRTCQSNGRLRKSTITIHQETAGELSGWPRVDCQKLLYDNSAVINSLSTKTNFDYKNRLQDIAREWIYESAHTNSIGNWSLCDSTGCTCSPGFRGTECKYECVYGTYGYGCKETCGSCKKGACSVINGYCSSGCSTRWQLPPLCQKDLELEAPIIMNLTDSTVRVLQRVEYPIENAAKLQFKLCNEGWSSTLAGWYPAKTAGKSTYEANITNLETNKEYKIGTFGSLTIAGQIVEVNGREINFETRSWCQITAERCLNVVSQKTSLTVHWSNSQNKCGYFPSKCHLHGIRIDSYNIGLQKFPYTSNDDLFPGTEYKVTIYGYENLWTKTVRTRESAPGKVGALNSAYVSDIEVALQWTVPSEKNGIITMYRVSIQRISLRGCVDPERNSPFGDEISREVNDTSAYFNGLHPYAKYNATVIAYTSEPGPEQSYEFETREADIPTSSVSKLELDRDKTRLEWKDPEDCTTISGSVKTKKVVLTPVSQTVQNQEMTRDIDNNYLNLKSLGLASYTSYRVRVYIVGRNGGVNETLYQEKNWTTPPSAPSAVSSLEVFDADPEGNISLRWEPPNPPNGQIEFYTVIINKGSKILINSTIEDSKGIPMCELGKNYVCLENLNLSAAKVSTVQIQVTAKNKYVEEAGKPNDMTFVLEEYYNEAPGMPRNLTAIDQSYGTVMLAWVHPSHSPSKITQFRIVVEILDSDLLDKPGTNSSSTIDHPVAKREKEYSSVLCLLPSTSYRFTVVAVNRRNISSDQTQYQHSVPQSIGFANDKELKVEFDGISMTIDIPKIANATQNTTLMVIVRGPLMCTPNQSPDSSSPVIMGKPAKEWNAADYQIRSNENETLTIRVKKHQGVKETCSLDPNEPYTIVFFVKGSNLVGYETMRVSLNPQKPNLTWLIIIIPIIIVICLLLLFVYRKYRNAPLKMSQQNILQLEQMRMDMEDSTASSTLKHGKISTDATINQGSIRQSSPDVIPLHNPNSCPVNIEKFEEYTRKAFSENLLDLQYEMLPKTLMKPCEYASIPENLPKNRYKDRIPYDETRVVLTRISEEPHSDYINASYVQGYRKKKAYIATQGPKPKTVKDFWRMVWQEKVQVISMLANVTEGGKRKCEQYWPEVGTKIKYGEILISNTKNLIYADYTFRTFTLRYKKEAPREVTHLHFTGWPDHGVPMYTQSLVAYLKKLLATSSGTGPVVVHCSAGVGRTGTIILCDTCLRQAAVERIIDVPAVLLRIREDRPNMVDNAQQYLLAHLAIVESMIVEQTQIRCDNFFPSKIIDLRKQLPSDVRRLKDTVWQDRALHSLKTPGHLTQEALTANRISKLVSASSATSRSELSSKRKVEDNCIDAVNVDGARMKNQYIAARLPSNSALFNFWKLVKDQNIELVVMLQRPESKDRTCCDIVPGESVLVPSPNMQVERKTSPEEREHFTIDKLLLSDISTETKLPVTVLTCTGWGRGKRGKPPTPAVLVSLWIASEKIARKEGQTLVLCQDGITGCGLYLALSFLLERITVEGECDVISAVRAIRRSRTEFVQSLDQFECLYDAAVNYVKCFEIYANFS